MDPPPPQSASPDFQVLFQSSPGLCLVLAADMKIVAASDAYLRATMTKREEIVGRDLFDVFPDNPEDPSADGSRKIRASLERVRSEKIADEMPVQKYDIRRPDAEGGGFEERYWRPNNLPILDAAGNLVFILNCVEDVTSSVREEKSRADRVNAEEALRRSEEHLRLFIEHVYDYAILMLDTDGRVVTWNDGARRIKGYEAVEILGEHHSRFYSPEDVAAGKPQTGLSRAAAEGRWVDEGWRLRKDGSRFWADVVLTAVHDHAGYLRGFAKITRDVTERKRSERALAERTTQVESANHELEAFSYSVSHDLRAPLRSIDGFSQVLLEDFAARLGPEGRHPLERIRAATTHMGALIDDMLKLSQVTRAEIRNERVDLSALARGVAADASRRDPSRRVEVSIADGGVAQGDQRLLTLVLENLIVNAFKFTSRTPEPRVEFGFQNGGSETIFFVRDNGAGFDMKYVGKLFGAFQRLHTTAEFPGTGIGLATVQRVLHRHSGRVWAESTTGRGATFYFTVGSASDVI